MKYYTEAVLLYYFLDFFFIILKLKTFSFYKIFYLFFVWFVVFSLFLFLLFDLICNKHTNDLRDLNLRVLILGLFL